MSIRVSVTYPTPQEFIPVAAANGIITGNNMKVIITKTKMNQTTCQFERSWFTGRQGFRGYYSQGAMNRRKIPAGST